MVFVEPVRSVVGLVHVLRANYALYVLTPELWWSHHRLYLNRLFGPT